MTCLGKLSAPGAEHTKCTSCLRRLFKLFKEISSQTSPSPPAACHAPGPLSHSLPVTPWSLSVAVFDTKLSISCLPSLPRSVVMETIEGRPRKGHGGVALDFANIFVGSQSKK